MVCIIALIFAAFFVGLAKIFAKEEGYYSSVVVFGIGAFVYYLSIPLEMELIGIQYYSVGENLVSIGPGQQAKIALLGLLAFLSFALGYSLSNFRPVKILRNESDAHIPFSSIIVLIFAVAVIVIFTSFSLSRYADYVTSYTSAYKNSAQTYFLFLFNICSCIIAATKFNSRRFFLGALLIAPSIAFGIWSSNKDYLLIAMLSPILGVFGIYLKRFSSLALISGGSFLVLTLVPVFSLYRSGVGNWSDYYFSMTNIDPAGPMHALALVTSQPSEMLFGSTYWESITGAIPKSLWPDRPIGLSEAFAKDQLQDWAPGRGLGYSLLAEAYSNFSYFGACIQYLLIGWLWGLFWMAIKRLLRDFPVFWSANYYVLGYYVLATMHRGPVAGITKIMFNYFLPFVFLFLLLEAPKFYEARRVAAFFDRKKQES